MNQELKTGDNSVESLLYRMNFPDQEQIGPQSSIFIMINWG